MLGAGGTAGPSPLAAGSARPSRGSSDSFGGRVALGMAAGDVAAIAARAPVPIRAAHVAADVRCVYVKYR